MDSGLATREQLGAYRRLKEFLTSLGSVAVAFSGGVDSSFLLHAARESLGDRCAAFTAVSAFYPEHELEDSRSFCSAEGITQYIIRADILSHEDIAANPPDRCYLCKKEIFSHILERASSLGFSHLAEGSNTDDDGDFRPGHRAIRELGVLSPLRACGLSKGDIRALSHAFGLAAWNKPACACLASRVPYGETLTEEKLRMIDRAERILREKGFSNLRVRAHGTLARIELMPEELPLLYDPALRETVDRELRTLGFTYTALDLRGYRTGSLNEVLTSTARPPKQAGL